MKSFLCILFLVTYLNVFAANQDVTESDLRNSNDNQKLTYNDLSNENASDFSELLIDNENTRTKNSNSEEGVDSLMEDTNSGSDEYDEDTETEDSGYGIKEMFKIIEEEIYKRLSAIEKSFEDEGNEHVSQTKSSASDITVTEKNESHVKNSEIPKSDVENSITENENADTKTQIENIQNSEIEISKTVLKGTETMKNSEKNDQKTTKSSENVVDDKIDTKITKIDTQNVNTKKSENRITDLDNIQSEAEDFDIDNYYEELLNSDLGDAETFKEFIGDDEDAYSVVDITLPSDTQFEMIKYDKVLNGRKVVLMKLLPVGSTLSANEDQLTIDDKVTSESAEANVMDKNKELLIPVTNTVHPKDSNINEKGTKAQNKTLISIDSNTNNENRSDISSDSVTGDLEEISNKRTPRNSEVVSYENIAEDVDDSSTRVGSQNNSKLVSAEEDGGKWCVCYNKLSDIPWVVRMQMGV